MRSGHYPGIDGTLERTYPTAAPGTPVMKMKMRMTKLTMKDKMLIIFLGLKKLVRSCSKSHNICIFFCIFCHLNNMPLHPLQKGGEARGHIMVATSPHLMQK